MTKTLTKAQLLKLAKNETDTVRSAHFRRMAEGADGIGHLTVKDDTKREKRDELIAGLKPIKPVVEHYDGPREPHSNDIAVLQKQVDDLKADTVDLSGHLSDAQKALEDTNASHLNALGYVQLEHEKTLATREESIAGLTTAVEARDEAIETGKAALALASDGVKEQAKTHEAELAESVKAIADRDKEISELKSAVAERDTQIEDLTKPKEDA